MSNKKRKFLSIILILSLFVGMVGYLSIDTTYAASKKIHLKKTSITLVKGKTYQQKLYDKKGKTIKATKVKWKSAKPSVAKINKKGKITAVKVGTAKMTAKYKGKTYKFTVKVKKAVSGKSAGIDAIYKYVKSNGYVQPSGKYISGDYCIESETKVEYNSRGQKVETTYAISIKSGNKNSVYFNMNKLIVDTGTNERTMVAFNKNSNNGEAGFLQGYYADGKFYQYISGGTIYYEKYTGKDYTKEKGIVDIYEGFNKTPLGINSYGTKYLVDNVQEMIIGVDKLLRDKIGIRLNKIGFSNL